MRNKYSTLWVLLILFSSITFGQLYILDFEGSDPLSNLPVGVSSIDAQNTVRVKNTTDYTPVPNAVQSDDTEGHELFLDFQGYLKLDISDASKGFSIAYNYRRSDVNDDWWLGFLTFIGNDGASNRLEQALIRQWDGQLHSAGVDSSGSPLGFLTNYHIVLTIDINGDMKIYVNGNLELDVPNSTSGRNIHTWANLSTLISFKGNSFNGSVVTPESEYASNCRDARVFVDNVALFEETLSATQVIDLYNKGNNALSTNTYLTNSDFQTTIYPNPITSGNYLNVKIVDNVIRNTLKFQIINLLGKVVQEELLVSDYDKFITNIENLDNGIYFVKGISNNTTLFTKKILIHKGK